MTLKHLLSYFAFLFVSLVSIQTNAGTAIISQHITTLESTKLIEQQQENPNFQIIDVRTPEEFAKSHIADSVLIDFYDKNFTGNLQKLDKEKTYLLYCRSGRRSANALVIMKQLGFKETYNMKGGMNQWNAEKRPTTKE